jgi:hypothetical protein
MSSTDYLHRCLDTINADTDISENTMIIMFQQYAKLISDEKLTKAEAIVVKYLGEYNNKKNAIIRDLKKI